MSAGADKRLEGFRMEEKGKWWCRMDGGVKGQRRHVTKGKRQGEQCLLLPRSQTGKTKRWICAVQATVPDKKRMQG
jgi:hypothetical protein